MEYFIKLIKKKSDTDIYLEAFEEILDLAKSGKGKIDKFDFVCKMLIDTQKCTKREIRKLCDEFDNLDINNDGVLDEKDFNNYKKQQSLLDDDGAAHVQMTNIDNDLGSYDHNNSTGLI